MRFRLGSIPVRIQGSFILTALLLGASFREPSLIVMWIAIVFVSVLVHELGHALAGKAFGLVPVIDLHGMGGTTSWVQGRDVGALRSIVISVAGPFTGIIIGAALYAALARGWTPGGGKLALVAVSLAVRVNLYWGIVNLAPMLPLDGGNVMRAVLNGVTGGRGEKAARIISIGVAGMALVYSVLSQEIWLGFLSAMFAFNNVQALRRASQAAVDAPLADAVEKAGELLQNHDGAGAIALLRPAIAPGVSLELRTLAVRLYAYALMLESRWAELMPLLARERALIGKDDLAAHAKAARELGRIEDATRIEALIATASSPATAPMANDFRA